MTTAGRPGFEKVFDATIGRLWFAKIWDRVDRSLPSTRQMLSKPDIYLAIGLGVVGLVVSIWGFAQTNKVPALHETYDLWFDADVARVAENLVSTGGNHGRTSVHPVFSILLYPFGAILTALGMNPLLAAKTLVVVIMGANAALFSLTLRLLELPRIAVAIFTLLFISTASFMFWGAVVESHPFSGFSVLLAIFMMLRVRTAHWSWWVLVNVLSLGFLITNWVFALIAMAVRLKLKSFVAICIASLSLVTALAVVQNMTFERAALFFNPETLIRETHHTVPGMVNQGVLEDGWQPASNLRSIYVTTVVGMPIEVQHGYRRLVTTNQHTGFPSGEVSPVIAVAAWVTLLGMGFWGATRRRKLRLLYLGLALMLGVKTIFFSIYGPVTFLYNQNFVPLLIIFASSAHFAPYRVIAPALASIVILFGSVNNERRLQETITVADCLSKIDEVMQRHSYAIIRVERPPEPTDYSELYTDNVKNCTQKTSQ